MEPTVVCLPPSAVAAIGVSARAVQRLHTIVGVVVGGGGAGVVEVLTVFSVPYSLVFGPVSEFAWTIVVHLRRKKYIGDFYHPQHRTSSALSKPQSKPCVLFFPGGWLPAWITYPSTLFDGRVHVPLYAK